MSFTHSIALTFLLVLSALAAGCGDVCDRQQKVIEADCGIELPDTENTGENVVCDDEAERAARCATKHKDDYCEWLAEFMNGNYEFTNAYTECVEDTD